MNWFLVLIPMLVCIGSMAVYRFIGRRELLKFDLVQFIYAFVVTPLTFVWGKVLLFLLIKNNADSPADDITYLLLDSSFSVIFLYIFGFNLLHSLTKSVSLKLLRDPRYNIFNYLEYFHLWISHLIVFGGGMLILTILSLTNVFFPLDLVLPRYTFYGLMFSGLIFGGLIFMGLWLCDPRQAKGFHFMRVMKLLIGLLFIIHVVTYFVFEPKLEPSALLFWWSAISFTMMTGCALFSYRSARAQSWLERLSNKVKHPGFEFRAQLE